MTKYGEPELWTPEEVEEVYIEKARKEFEELRLHCYLSERRMWAMKPLKS